MTEKYMPEEMKKDLAAALEELKAIEAKVAPIRAQYDALSQSSAAQLKVLSEQFKALEAPMGPLKAKIAVLARAVGRR